MTKRILLCLLVFLLILPSALAENTAPFEPGSTTKDLFSQAYDQGDMILMDMHWGLKTNENLSNLLGTDAAAVQAVSEALENAVLTLGLSKIDGGHRALIAAYYEADDQQASLDLTVDFTRDGLAVMSSLIPGERLSAQWETLLALAGMDETEIVELLSLRELDWNAMLANLYAQSAAILESVSRIAAPYGETVLAHLAALPMEVATDVAADGAFPAAATEISILVTQKALGELVIALADQLEQDATLCVILDAILSESGEEITAAQLCQSAREAAANLTDESLPLSICIGMDENDNLLYLNVYCKNEANESILFNVIGAPSSDAEAMFQVSIDLFTLAADDSLMDGFSTVILCSDEQLGDAPAAMQLYADVFTGGEALAHFELTQNEETFDTEDGLRGIGGEYAIGLSGTDSESTISAFLFTDTACSETADGGEQIAASGSMEFSMDDAQLPITFEVYSLTEPGQDGPLTSINAVSSIPLLGVDEYAENYLLYTAAIDPEVKTELALETASAEALQDLETRILSALEETLTQLLTLLPDSLTDLLSRAEIAAVQS